MRSSSKVTRKLASPNAPLGYTLCLVNLVLDGYTNAAQVGQPCCAVCWAVLGLAGLMGDAACLPAAPATT